MEINELLIIAGYNDNSWGGQNVRKSYDYYPHSNNRGNDYQQHNDGGKIEQRMQNLRLDSSKSSGGESLKSILLDRWLEIFSLYFNFSRR